MRNRTRLVLFAVIAIAMSIVPSRAGTPQSDVQDEEYAVYSALIQSRLAAGHKLAVILNRTQPESWEEDVVGLIKEAMPSVPLETLEAYRMKNKESYLLSRSFKMKTRYVLVDGERMHGGRKAFYRKYPDSRGLLTFSRVAFNPDRSRSVVYVWIACGDLCGAGIYFSLVKESGDWKVEKEWTHLVS